jgi:NAD(P)H dehydrogenase (quinone)
VHSSLPQSRIAGAALRAHPLLMRNTLVLLGHADPDSFNARLARTYTDAIRDAGAQAESITLSELDFDPVLRRGFAGEQTLEPDLVRVRDAIERADHLAWFFPT